MPGPVPPTAMTYAQSMELVVAPIAELKARITHQFEELAGATLDRGAGMSPEPHSFTCGLTGGLWGVVAV